MPAPFYVYVADLEPTIARKATVAALNPDWDGERPCVHVGILRNERPTERFATGDFSGTPKPVRSHGRAIHPEMTSRHTKEEGALSRQEKLIEELRLAGWCVTNRPAEPTYSVYVIELNRTVSERPGVIRSNPNRDPDQPCAYVGQSSKSPEDRLRAHLKTKSGSKYVTPDTVIGLRHDVFDHLNPMTKLQSYRMERLLATSLRHKGWTIVGGH